MRNSPSFIHSSASSVPGSSRLPASGRSLPPRLPFRSRIPVPRSSDSSWQSLLSGIIVYRWSFIVHCFGRNPLSAGSLKGNAAGAANPPPLRRRNGPPPLQRADSGYAGLTPLYPQKTMGTSPSVYPPLQRADSGYAGLTPLYPQHQPERISALFKGGGPAARLVVG